MSYSPILIAHICAGTSGLLSGTAAMSFRKGSPRHALAGKVFVASMLTMAVLAVYLAIVRHQPNNIGGGILTFYLVGTAWLTARRRDGETSRLDWGVLLIPLALGTLTWMFPPRVPIRWRARRHSRRNSAGPATNRGSILSRVVS